LTGKPDLTVKADKTYVDTELAKKADSNLLANIATTGSYNDLSDLPVVKTPTITKYSLAGSGTYITPAGAKWLKVTVIGGGGGGGGGGASGTMGGAGGVSQFGNITANGGLGSTKNTAQPTPTAGSFTSGWAGDTYTSELGTMHSGLSNSTSSYVSFGGKGGSSCLGTGGHGGKYSGGTIQGLIGYRGGGGGGGADTSGTSNIYGAPGGNSGGCVIVISTGTLEPTYDYVVGAGGTGGTGGGGTAGGIGGDGYILIEEHY
jgi:hypothetical protein